MASSPVRLEDSDGDPINSANPLPVTLSGGGGGSGADVNLTDVGGAPLALGQTTMAGSLPVVIASNQPAISTKPDKAAAANTPAIVTSGGDVIASNANRKAWAIQNLGTNPLFVRLATGASSTVFHVVLKGCAVADDGSGGYFSDEVYTGVVSATGTSPRFAVTEL